MAWVLVTGASSDVGSAIALAFARQGYNLLLQGFRHLHRAEAIAKEARKLNCEAIVIQARFDRPGGVAELCKTTQHHTDGVEIVVNAAASGIMRSTEQLSEKHLKWTFDVSTFPIVTLAQLLRPKSLVAISSRGADRVVPSYGAIGASKAALEALVRYLAVELAPDTRVNAISAGLVDTATARKLPDYLELAQRAKTATPMSRLVTCEDIAGLCYWLCSEDAFMITGEVITLDGGYGLIW